jgi:hypothetical protein
MVLCEKCRRKFKFFETKHTVDLGFEQGIMILCKDCAKEKIEKNDLSANPCLSDKDLGEIHSLLLEHDVPCVDINDSGNGPIQIITLKIIDNRVKYDKKIGECVKNWLETYNMNILDLHIGESTETIKTDKEKTNYYLEYNFKVQFRKNFKN